MSRARRRRAPQPPRLPARRRRRGGRASLPGEHPGTLALGRRLETRFRFLHLHRGRRRPLEILSRGDGALTQAGLAAAGKATSALAAHADNLLLLSGINWPPGSSRGDSHVDGLCVALTGKLPQEVQDVTKVTAGGPSADSFIAAKVHPGKAPIALYAGNVRNGYEAQRLSFAGPGQLNPVVDNPYNLYRELMGLLARRRSPATRPLSCCSRAARAFTTWCAKT